ncbi:MAG TPA: hypothetical protein VHJ19_07530 [Gammaproteobacteria bacterium]|nr:hypothetical protein [Gammaproteobacteria bacterium]
MLLWFSTWLLLADTDGHEIIARYGYPQARRKAFVVGDEVARQAIAAFWIEGCR